MPEYIDLLWAPADDELSGLSKKDRRAGRYRAFVPDTIADREFELSSSTLAAADQALQAVTRADERVGAQASFLHHLLVRSESISSSYIEGINVTPKRLALAEVLGRGGSAARAVLGNVRATESAVTTMGDPAHVITIDDLEQLQRSVAPAALQGVRDVQNWVGGTGYSPLRAQFVPPPPERVRPLLDDLLAFVNAEAGPSSAVNSVVRAAVAHAQFETIHPFADGNGRTGRALIHALLRRAGVARHLIVPVSTVFAAHTDAYVSGLTAFRGQPQQLDDWVTGFAEALSLAAGNAVLLTQQVNDLDGELRRRLIAWREAAGLTPVRPRTDAVVWSILGILAEAPVVTAATVSERFGVSRVAAGRALGQLQDARVLKRVKDQHGNTVAFTSDAHLGLVALVGRRNLAGGRDTAVVQPRRAPAAPADDVVRLHGEHE